MISNLKGKEITLYDYFNSNFNRKNTEAIRDRSRKDAFDAADTMRLLDVAKEKIYTPAEINFYREYYKNVSDYNYNRFN